ncbi:MAG TPA: methionine biosynthesis protein MetW [Acidimicrobiales bacterium]|nr:methionine biosynthesis protein MetW [Acidimicrobiales bacterium]
MSPPTPAIEELIAQVRARVAERRRSGFYPAGLENDLDAHFRRIVSHRRGVEAEALRASLQELDQQARFSPERIPTTTRVPGGSVAHAAVAKVTSRQTQGVLEQVQAFADATRATLRLLVEVYGDPDDHLGDLVAQLDAIWERLAAWERGPAEGHAAVGDLRRRVEALEAAEQARTFTPPYSAAAFEAAFRGSGDDLKARYGDLAAVLDGFGPVLDVGCGRGELLELLAARGTPASGVEIDPALVDEGRANGLSIASGDGIAHLAALPDGSLGAVVLVQVVEHLTPQEVIDLAVIARDKVRAGGMLLMETINPQSLYTFAHAFYLDPTHHHPVHPAYLEFVVRQSGWPHVRIEWRSPPPETERLAADPGATAVGAANIERLNALLFGPQDYALVAFT